MRRGPKSPRGSRAAILWRPSIASAWIVMSNIAQTPVRQRAYAGYSASFRTEAISPIQNKIGKALMDPRLRNMLAQPKSTITQRRLMDEGAIVICNLSKGALGESTAHLLGALLASHTAPALRCFYLRPERSYAATIRSRMRGTTATAATFG
jgi:hypothetical protein